MFGTQTPRGLTVLAVLVSVMNAGATGPAATAAQQLPVGRALETYSQKPEADIAQSVAARPDFQETLRHYRGTAEAWAASARGAERTRRQQAGVAFAMELVARSVDGPMEDYNIAKPLIEWACSLLAQTPPSELERAVHLTSVAILHGTADYVLHGFDDGQNKRPGHLDHAAKRYPDDERFKLARVLTRYETRVIATRPLGPTDLRPSLKYQLGLGESVKRLNETFELLSSLDGPLVADEAKLRRGVMAFLTGRRGEAAQDLGIASTSESPFVSYLANVMLGTLYYRTGETAAAVGRYSKAAHVLPATAAQLGLAAALLRLGRGQEAADVTDAWAKDSRIDDPWQLYGLGLFHELPRNPRSDESGTQMKWTALATLVAAVALAASTAALSGQQLQLRSMTSSVAVHVLVRNTRGPVRDLTAADFELKDSGVTQQIATMTVESLLLDVSIVVDQLRQSEYSKKDRHPYLEEIENLLSRDDRLGVISVGSDVHEVVPLAAATGTAGGKPEKSSDQAAVFDGVARALLRATPPGRQHVVIVLTEGYDAYSFTSPQVLTDIAGRSDAQMHVLASEGVRSKSRGLARAPAPLGVYDGLAMLVDLARASGGDLFAPTRLKRSVTTPVKRIFDDVRAGYVLYYTPSGVTDKGWHPIEVTVTRPGRFEVRARRGYAN